MKLSIYKIFTAQVLLLSNLFSAATPPPTVSIEKRVSLHEMAEFSIKNRFHKGVDRGICAEDIVCESLFLNSKKGRTGFMDLGRYCKRFQLGDEGVVTSDGGGLGIDSIAFRIFSKKSHLKVQVIICEVKADKAELSDTADGEQMSYSWLAPRLKRVIERIRILKKKGTVSATDKELLGKIMRKLDPEKKDFHRFVIRLKSEKAVRKNLICYMVTADGDTPSKDARRKTLKLFRTRTRAREMKKYTTKSISRRSKSLKRRKEKDHVYL